MDCPDSECSYSGPSFAAVNLHWNRSKKHSGVLSEKYPSIDNTYSDEHCQSISEASDEGKGTVEVEENVQCPMGGCEKWAESGFGVMKHWNQQDSHPGKLKDHHPDFDVSRKDGVGEAISEAKSGINVWEDKEHPQKGESVPEETREKISNTLEGHDYVSEEQRKKTSERMEGNDYASGYERTDAQLAGLEKGWNMERTEEWNQNISEALKGNKNGRRHRVYVFELGHQVDSSWELDVAFLLKTLGADYEREPAYTLWDDTTYYPDFRVGRVVIEVKGYADDYSHEKAGAFLEEHPDDVYVVVGDEMECDLHIEWENRQRLTEVITYAQRVGSSDLRQHLVTA
jgi:hypothetical protein